jgi:uncharacterized membrane protein
MKKLLVPVIVLIVLCTGFVVYLLYSAPLLPERMASHFGAGGGPNGWMSRSSHLWFMGAFGVGVSLFIAIMGLVTRFIPVHLVNLPNREYWLSPEHRAQTCNYISRHLLWMACLIVVFFTGLEYMIVEANRMSPVHMPMGKHLFLLGSFLAVMVSWTIVFYRHFSKTD